MDRKGWWSNEVKIVVEVCMYVFSTVLHGEGDGERGWVGGGVKGGSDGGDGYRSNNSIVVMLK